MRKNMLTSWGTVQLRSYHPILLNCGNCISHHFYWHLPFLALRRCQPPLLRRECFGKVVDSISTKCVERTFVCRCAYGRHVRDMLENGLKLRRASVTVTMTSTCPFLSARITTLLKSIIFCNALCAPLIVWWKIKTAAKINYFESTKRTLCVVEFDSENAF